MIVVVANRWDQSARTFAERWKSYDVRVLTAQDLSSAGWRQGLNAEDAHTAVVDGIAAPQDQITGTLTRLFGVGEEELPDIAAGDREYVAAEMTAFLWFWLSSLSCPVLSRPTPACLTGPHWRRESWVRAAAQAGIPVETVHRGAGFRLRWTLARQEELRSSSPTVTVVGDQTIGEADRLLHRQARVLARFAGVELLAVRFSSPDRDACFVSANVFPDLTDDRVSAAILEHLER